MSLRREVFGQSLVQHLPREGMTLVELMPLVELGQSQTELWNQAHVSRDPESSTQSPATGYSPTLCDWQPWIPF